MKRIAIAGGGIAGLSIAHALLRRGVRESGIELVVLERSARPGGNIWTDAVDGYLCERGPNGFLDNAPATLKLVGDLGLQTALQPSDDRARRRFVFRNGRLHEVPTGPVGFLSTRLLSWAGKLRIAAEPWAATRPASDETIHAFAARRIGREAADVLIDAMVSGVFGGDARRLSLRACFPRMWELETMYGGLFRALVARRRERRAAKGGAIGSPLGRLTSFRRGTEHLIAALVAALGDCLRPSADVVSVTRHGSTYALVLADGSEMTADAVVLATTAPMTARLVDRLDGPLAATLAQISTAPMVVVCLGYSEARLARPLDGFGLLVPRGEGPRLLGVLWDSSIYPGRAPAGKVLIRAMMGGAHDPQAITLDDDAVLAAVRPDLTTTMGLRAEPEFVRVFRHPVGIPQYTVGHLDRLAAIDARLAELPGLFLAGNSYRGVAINACIAEADGIAEKVLGRVRECEAA
jgi:oxygen-dependent protoporphyrinogen oxidase